MIDFRKLRLETLINLESFVMISLNVKILKLNE